MYHSSRCHSLTRQSGGGSWRLALLETLHATSLLSPPTPAALSALPPFLFFLSFACAPIGRRFGNPCEHLFPSSRPPSRDPGQPFAGYCIALPPRRCSSSHSPPKVRLRANWAAVRQSVRAPLPVIPASEPESWAAFCVVLRCAIASLVFILACASLLDSGSSPE